MYKLILAFCYLFRRRISYLAFCAVGLCVFIVVVVMTVMTGLVDDFRRKNYEFTGDCVVGTDSLVGFPYYEDFMKVLEQADCVEGVSPVIKSYALISVSGSERGRGVEIMGIDPVRHSRVTNFGKTLHYNKTDASKAFMPVYDPNLAGCVLGIDMVLVRDVKGDYSYSDVPDRRAFSISCFPLTVKGALAKAGAGEVNTKVFYYSDNSHSGLARVDSSAVYLPFEQAQILCGMDEPIKRVSAIHIKFRPGVRLETGCEKVASLWQKFVEGKKGEQQADLLKNVAVQSWKSYRRMVIAAMEKEQAIITVMFALVGITTVFIVFVVFYMVVSHKTKDIGVLKSIGASDADIIELFLAFALLLGLISSAVGAVCGWLFLQRINRLESWLFGHFGFQLWDRSIYAIGDIPSRIDAEVLTVIVLSAITACLIGAFVPSRQAAKAKPAETLQVNQL